MAKKADLREKVLDIWCSSNHLLRVGLDVLKGWTGNSRLSVVSDITVDGMSVCDTFRKASSTRIVVVIGTTTRVMCLGSSTLSP